MYRLVFIFILIFYINSCSQKDNISPAYANLNQNLTFDGYFINKLNEIRAKGTNCAPPAPPLRLNSALKKAAMAHARDMAMNNFLSHNGSGTPFDVAKGNQLRSSFIDRILFFGYPAKSYDLVGEAVKRVSLKKSADERELYEIALKDLIKDKSHCEILMNPRFKDVGFGVYRGKNYYYVVIDLGEVI